MLQFMVIFCIWIIGCTSSIQIPNPPVERLSPCEDCGSRLFLTPLIESGRVKEARKLSKVKFCPFRGVKSHSGYFTVNKNHDSNLFFWYVESASERKDAPVLLWIQGGPASSSMYGFFAENGPFYFKRDRIKRRKYSWHKDYHMLYIDNPVGTGFSFTKDGYAQNQTVVGENMYNALVQFFKLFPKLKKKQFYVTGESYGGRFVSAICHIIHNRNKRTTDKINLQGFSFGSGYVDPYEQINFSDQVYQLGLVDKKGRDIIRANENEQRMCMSENKWIDAYKLHEKLLGDGSYQPNSILYNLTGISSVFDYFHPRDPASHYFETFFQGSKIRKALHVGNVQFNNREAVRSNLVEHFMRSVDIWVTELLSHYRGLFYNGQLDVLVSYPVTEHFLNNLNFSSAEEYKMATRRIWRVDGEIAGYSKTAGNLTEVLVRNAGHMVLTDQPKWGMDLINRFTKNLKFYQ